MEYEEIYNKIQEHISYELHESKNIIMPTQHVQLWYDSKNKRKILTCELASLFPKTSNDNIEPLVNEKNQTFSGLAKGIEKIIQNA